MEDRSEFLVPWDIMSEWTAGELDSQKSPTKYTKLRKSELSVGASDATKAYSYSADIFPERKPRAQTDWRATCHCEPESGCGENCLNRCVRVHSVLSSTH
jgi:hypothetical protein